MKYTGQAMRAVALKELKQLSRDPVSVALTLVFPILLVMIIVNVSSAFSAPSYDIPIVVADLDNSHASRVLLDKLRSSRVVSVIEIAGTEQRALNAVQAGSATGAIIIPKGFDKSLANGKDTFIILATDSAKLTSSSLITNLVNRYALKLPEDITDQAGSSSTSIDLVVKPISGRPPSGDAILPGMLGMITILGAFDDILNVVSRERERGTYPRLLLTPSSMLSIYSGKILSALVLTALRTTLMLVIFALTGLIVKGSIALVFMITTLIAFFTLSLGLVLSSRVRSSSTLTVLEIAITFPLFQLTASTNSRQTLAEGGKAIASALPWTYGNEALRRVIYLGLGLEAIASDLLILFISGLIMLPVALALSERTM